MELVSDSTVYLVEHMGGDKAVVNSARVSFGKEHDDAPITNDDIRLITFLMGNRHGTPFESTVFTFRIETPIFVAREWLRHRIGSFNEMSGRYKELPMRFFMPDEIRTQTGKPGAYTFKRMEDEDTAKWAKSSIWNAANKAERKYRGLLENGVAREQARMVLPMSTMTQFYWTVNARSLMNFLSLRLHHTAMLEIRQAAQRVHTLFAEAMPHTSNAFADNDRVAP